MKKKKLPKIEISGVGITRDEVSQSLVEIETILVMAGYNNPKEELWNNSRGGYHVNNDRISCYEDGTYNYHLHYMPCQFRADRIEEVIEFLIKEGVLK